MKTTLIVLTVLSLASAVHAKSPTYWARMASRTDSDFAKKLYLDESARVAASRRHRTEVAKARSEARVKRIEARKQAKMPLTFEQKLAVMRIQAWASRPVCWYHHSSYGSHWVNSYYRGDGTHVSGYWRH